MMNTYHRFATNHPVGFAISIMLLMLVLYLLAGVLAEILSTNTAQLNLISAAGRLAGGFAFAGILLRFGWKDAVGLNRLGSSAAWLLAIGVLAYELASHALPLFADAEISDILALQTAAETAAVGLNALATGPLEEIPFRGLILYAFVRYWGIENTRIWRSVLASSFLFGASHLIHLLLGRPLPQAILVSANAFLAGIYYAAFVLRWRTIWPGVLIHGLLNATVGIVAFHTPGFQEPVNVLLLGVALQVPVVLLGVHLIARSPTRQVIPEAV